MSTSALQRVVVRMLYDPVLVEAVYRDAAKALAGVELTAVERGWLVAPDRRRYQADPLRRSRGLQALIEEFAVSAAGVAVGPGVGALDAFFSAGAFHRAVQAGRSLALAFGEWLAHFGGEVAAFAALEGGIARVRRAPLRAVGEASGGADFDRRWMTAPWAWGGLVPGGTLAAWQAQRSRLAAQGGLVEAVVAAQGASEAEPGVMLAPSLQPQEPEGLVVERTGPHADDVGVAEASPALAGLLAALEQPLPWPAAAAALRRLGAEPGEEKALAADLLADGLLTVD